MSTIQKNKLEVLIKIRNLSKGLHSKWQLLDDAKLMTENMLKEAQTVIKLLSLIHISEPTRPY